MSKAIGFWAHQKWDFFVTLFQASGALTGLTRVRRFQQDVRGTLGIPVGYLGAKWMLNRKEVEWKLMLCSPKSNGWKGKKSRCGYGSNEFKWFCCVQRRWIFKFHVTFFAEQSRHVWNVGICRCDFSSETVQKLSRTLKEFHFWGSRLAFVGNISRVVLRINDSSVA